MGTLESADPPGMDPVRNGSHVHAGRRIDFLVIGAPKSGTTTLHVALSLHPAIRVPARGGKELRHFSAPASVDPLADGALAGYHAAWDWHETGVRRGESTPGYLAHPEAPDRMRRYRRDLRLVAIFRAPVWRAFSGWNMAVQQGDERRSFDRAVRDELSGIPGQPYVSIGRYGSQLDRLFAAWPDAAVLPLRTEELALDPGPTFGRVFEFLGVRGHDLTGIRSRNVRPHLGSMHPATARLLDREFAGEIDRLAERFGWNLDAWRRTSASVPAWLGGEALRRATTAVPGLWRFGERTRTALAGFRSPCAARPGHGSAA